MENTEINTEQFSTDNTNKIAIGARIDPLVAVAIEQIANDEERTTSSVVDRLLRSHPRIQTILETTA